MRLFKSRQWNLNPSLPCLAIALWGFYLRFMLRLHRPFAGDELVEYQALETSAFTFWRRVAFYGDHTSFPGELIVNYPFVKIWGMNKWLISIPHVLINIIGFFLFYKLCQRFLQTKTAVISAFIIYSFNFNLVHYSLEFRPYAVLHVFAIVSLYLLSLLINQYDEFSKWQKLWIALVLIFIFIYHAYGLIIVFLPLCYVLSSALLKDKRTWVSFSGKLYLSIVLGIGVVLWSWYSSYSFFGLKPNAGQAQVQIFEYIPDPTRNPIGFLRGVIGNLFGGKVFYLSLLGVILAFLLPSNFKKFLSLIGFLLFLVVLPITAIFIIDIKNQYWFIQRQFIWVVPFWALFIGRCWDKTILKQRYTIL